MKHLTEAWDGYLEYGKCSVNITYVHMYTHTRAQTSPYLRDVSGRSCINSTRLTPISLCLPSSACLLCLLALAGRSFTTSATWEALLEHTEGIFLDPPPHMPTKSQSLTHPLFAPREIPQEVSWNFRCSYPRELRARALKAHKQI